MPLSYRCGAGGVHPDLAFCHGAFGSIIPDMIGKIAQVSSACMLLLLAACLAYSARSVPSAGPVDQAATRRIVFHVVDAEGKRIDWSAFRRLAENGPAGYSDDALLDPATLTLTRTGPLFSSNGMGDGDPSLTCRRRAGRTTSTSWPPRKCSTIFV
jgi:hypothetical protein